MARKYTVGAWYLELPKVDVETCPTKMDKGCMLEYNGCTYEVSRRHDLLRSKDKITIKFYDNRGFIVWKEEYYE